MDRRLIVVLAMATGLAVANLYYVQPLLATIARDFHEQARAVSLIVTMTQVGYAIGLMTVVPLGDLMERRALITTILMVTAAALAGAALSPTVGVLVVWGLMVGLTSVVAQILVPLAANLAGQAERGRVVGIIMSGLLIGVLLSRTLSGLIAQAMGWRSVYWIAAGLMVALSLVLRQELPVSRPQNRLSYPALLRSVVALVREEPLLRRRSFYGALIFAAFSVFWTSMAFLLAGPPYYFHELAIGLFGLLGAAGAVAASIAGRLADRGWHRVSTGIFLGTAALSYALIAWGGRNLAALVVGVMLLDLGVQGTHITNQSLIYRLRSDARSRLTTVYMTSYFIGGAGGSLASAAMYSQAGWLGVSAIGAGFLIIAFGCWAAEPMIPRQAPKISAASKIGADGEDPYKE